jgi:hypothetical protein
MTPSSDEDRLQDYLWNLEKIIPNPDKGWEEGVRPCKWDRILKERQNKNESISIIKERQKKDPDVTAG